MGFEIHKQFPPRGHQGRAIDALTKGLKAGEKHQVLHGVTGSGKTYTMANVINEINKPTLIISHNKTLAWQLYQEFKEFFPNNAVHYFVSYYDFYQPEAYIPQTDTYIQKDASINEKIDAMRHAAVQDLLTRKDTLVVASVSCIYNIGSPETYQKVTLDVKKGQPYTRKEFLRALVNLGFARNDFDPHRGLFSAKGNRVQVYPATGEEPITFEIENDTISRIGLPGNPIEAVKLFPANFWMTPESKLKVAMGNIRAELHEHLARLEKEGKDIEAHRLRQRTNYDLEMIEQIGYCSGIENYSRHLDFRQPDAAPFTLLDYFGDNFVTFIDESHMTIPQIRGMWRGDRARKETLIKHGFRLPSAVDNRPLTFSEFKNKIGRTVYVSATPREYEIGKSKLQNPNDKQIPNFKFQNKTYIAGAEQIVRPTGLLDPPIQVRSTNNQMKNAIEEIRKNNEKGQRTIVVTITKRLAEEIAEYLNTEGIKVAYIHSEIHTLERPKLMHRLRSGEYDVLVGINLLREGLDMPEVSLAIVFDADKEGFLRNETTLLQTIGRAARHVEGRAILYADKVTASMRKTISETKRRRKIQKEYNEKHGITPRSIEKKIYPLPQEEEEKKKEKEELQTYKQMALGELEREMKKAAKDLNFEKAAKLRDEINKLNKN